MHSGVKSVHGFTVLVKLGCKLPLYWKASPSVQVLVCPRGFAVLFGVDFPWHLRSVHLVLRRVPQFLLGRRGLPPMSRFLSRRNVCIYCRCFPPFQIIFGGGAFAPAGARRLATSFNFVGVFFADCAVSRIGVTAIRHWDKRGPTTFSGVRFAQRSIKPHAYLVGV